MKIRGHENVFQIILVIRGTCSEFLGRRNTCKTCVEIDLIRESRLKEI